MKIFEAIGMISTGALVALGGVYLFGGFTQNASTDAPATDMVTRADTDLSSVGGANAAQRISQIVALSQEPLRRTEELSPMQREAIAFFERIARKQNAQRGAETGDGLRFNNMAVDQLNVRYFYTVDAPYRAMNRGALLAEQERLVVANLCESEAIRTLMTEYGFKYDYSYVSSDGRLAGRVMADAGSCR